MPPDIYELLRDLGLKIDALSGKVDGRFDKHDERIRALEQFRAMAKVYIALASGLSGAAIVGVIEWLVRR